MKENPESRYWKIGPVYVKKAFLLTVLAAGSIAAIGYFGLPTELLPKPPAGTVYRYNDPALQELSGHVQILDDQGVIRYDGPVEKGVCTGFGRIYGENGDLVYDGPLVEGRYDGKVGRIYRDGKLVYRGGFRDGLYDGAGTLFDYENNEILNGGFIAGEPDGVCKSYNLSWRLVSTIAFENGEMKPEDSYVNLGGGTRYWPPDLEGSGPIVSENLEPTVSAGLEPTVSAELEQTVSESVAPTDSQEGESILGRLRNGIFHFLLNLTG